MKKVLLIFTIMLSLICTLGCQKQETKMESKTTLDQILEKNNYIVLDVRTKEEYDEKHVKGSLNIPYDTIDENTALDKTKTILVYCRSGARSKKAYDTLKSLGYDVYDLGAFDKITLEKE